VVEEKNGVGESQSSENPLGGIVERYRKQNAGLHNPSAGKESYVRIPLSWIAKVINLRGKEVPVLLVLWRLRRCQKKRAIKIPTKEWEKVGLKYLAFYRGLKGLEKSGIIRIQYEKDRISTVTIVGSDRYFTH
jgi:hypothetical protein